MSTKVILSAIVAVSALTLSTGAFAQAGISVVKDATTGQLRAPTAEEAKTLEALRAQQKSVKRVGKAAAGTPVPGTVITHKDGAVEMVMDPENASFSVMTKDAAGNLVLQCVTGKEAADKAMSNPASATKEHQHEAE